MICYSPSINQFLLSSLKRVRCILREEVGVPVRRKFFLLNQYYYPIKLVAFEHPQHLGEFDPNFYRISINKDLMKTEYQELLDDVLRHEIAHYLSYIRHGEKGLGHGLEFRSICREFNWSMEVSSAVLYFEPSVGDATSEKMVEKVKKLLRLASSSNLYESELATLKANELLLKHQLTEDAIFSNGDEEERLYIAQCLFFKKGNGKVDAILEILRTFFVEPVLNYGVHSKYLEVMGKKTNVEISLYVAKFLDTQLERLWKEVKVQNKDLVGQRAKDSFMRGVAKGYLSKQKSELDRVRSLDPRTEKNLIQLQGALKLAVQEFYGGFSRVRRSASQNADAHQLGRLYGKELSINPAIEHKTNYSSKLLV